MKNSKRRADKRKIRETQTYSVPQIAKALDKSEATVLEWIRSYGLATIDNLKPPMVYGYVLKRWHQDWWEGRKTKSDPDTFYCMGCRRQQRARQGSIIINKLAAGALQATGHCEQCGVKIAKSVKAESVAALFNPATFSSQKKGFDDSDISTSISLKITGSVGNSTDAPVDVRKGRARLLPGNAFNERLKAQYFAHLHHAKGRSDRTLVIVRAALMRYESHFNFRSFGRLSKADATSFKQALRDGPLTMPVVRATLETAKEFLAWLRLQKGFRERVDSEAIQWLSLSDKERRMATAIEKIPKAPKFEELAKIIFDMPATTICHRRDRAIMALLATTGARSSVLPTLRLKHVDVEKRVLYQISAEVDTKFSKNIAAILVPVQPLLVGIFLDYVKEIRSQDFNDDDPLFPKTVNWITATTSNAPSLTKERYADAQVILRLVKTTFERAGFQDYTIHSIRHAYGQLQNDPNIPLAVLKAISANLGHSSIRVTAASYGRQSLEERKRLLEDHFRIVKPENKVNERLRDEILFLLNRLM